MSTIIFTAGAKGGTGKSTAARFLITYVRHHGADPLLLDLDDENRTLSRFFPEALQVEIKKKSSHDVLVERALKGDSLIIADLKAAPGETCSTGGSRCRLKNFSHRGSSLCVLPR